MSTNDNKKDTDKYDSDEDIQGDIGFVMALIDDPVGRKLVLFMCLFWMIPLSFICGKEVMLIILASFTITAILVGLIFRYILDRDVTLFLKTLYYGYADKKKKKKEA